MQATAFIIVICILFTRQPKTLISTLFFCFVAPAMEAKGTCALQGKKMALEAGARSRCSAAPDGLLRCGKANGSQALSRAGAGPASRAIIDIISGRQKNKKKQREALKALSAAVFRGSLLCHLGLASPSLLMALRLLSSPLRCADRSSRITLRGNAAPLQVSGQTKDSHLEGTGSLCSHWLFIFA